MNSFVCATDKPFRFDGRINEDVNAYIGEGMRGKKFLTVPMVVAINQIQTQKSTGGLTEIYLDLGTYVKTFYTVMMNPSCVKVGTMGPVSPRLHHIIDWQRAVPAIIREKYRKTDNKGA